MLRERVERHLKKLLVLALDGPQMLKQDSDPVSNTPQKLTVRLLATLGLDCQSTTAHTGARSLDTVSTNMSKYSLIL